MNWDDLVASMKKKKKKKSKKKSRKSSRRSRSSRLISDIDGSSVASGSSGFRCSPIDESIDELDEEDDEEEEIDFEQKETTPSSSPYGIGNGSTFDVEYGGAIPEDVDEIDFHPPTYDSPSSHTANGMTVADQINELIEECQISSDKAYEMVVKYEGQEMVLLNHLKELRERMLSSPESGGISHSEYADDFNMSYDTGVNNGYTNKRRRKCAIGFAILVLLAGIVGGVMVAVKNSSSSVPEEFGGPSSTTTADDSTPDVTDQVEDADRMPVIEGDNEYSGEYDDISYGYETGQGGVDQAEQEAMEATKEEFQQQHPELDGETSQETVIKEEIEAVENEGETNAEESDIIYPWSRQ